MVAVRPEHSNLYGVSYFEPGLQKTLLENRNGRQVGKLSILEIILVGNDRNFTRCGACLISV